jgi:Iron dependent repressor, metal binding and dimerisation domain
MRGDDGFIGDSGRRRYRALTCHLNAQPCCYGATASPSTSSSPLSASEDLGREAERLASVISDEVDDALTELLNDPHVCPHGNAIPAAD